MSKINSNAKSIFGIPCHLKEPKVISAVESILRYIQKRFPRDFALIAKRVRAIRPMPKRYLARGAEGCWELDKGYGCFEPVEYTAQGTLYLPNSVVQTKTGANDLLAIIVHELGHVCTRLNDFESRFKGNLSLAVADLFDGRDCEEVRACVPVELRWISEMCADHHSKRWGFGNEMLQNRIGNPKKPTFFRYGDHPLPGFLVLIQANGLESGVLVKKNWSLQKCTRRSLEKAKKEAPVTLLVDADMLASWVKESAAIMGK